MKSIDETAAERRGWKRDKTGKENICDDKVSSGFAIKEAA